MLTACLIGPSWKQDRKDRGLQQVDLLPDLLEPDASEPGIFALAGNQAGLHMALR